MYRLDQTGYLAPEDRVDLVVNELRDVAAVHGRLVIANGPPQTCRWAQNVWLELYELHVTSISDAARQLCALQRNWWPYVFHLNRRSELTRARGCRVSQPRC